MMKVGQNRATSEKRILRVWEPRSKSALSTSPETEGIPGISVVHFLGANALSCEFTVGA